MGKFYSSDDLEFTLIISNVSVIYNKPTRCNSGSIMFIKNTSMLYMFRTPFASIFRSTINYNSSHWCLS